MGGVLNLHRDTLQNTNAGKPDPAILFKPLETVNFCPNTVIKIKTQPTSGVDLRPRDRTPSVIEIWNIWIAVFQG